MLFRPVSVDELIDELATQAPHLTDAHLTRLGELVGSLSGNNVSLSDAGGARIVSGSVTVAARPLVPSGTASDPPIPESPPVEDRCLRCDSTDGWPLCPACQDPEPRTKPGQSPDQPRIPTIADWAEAQGYARLRGRPPRWAVEGWRRANPDAPELPIERKLAAEAARREQQPPASYDVRVVEQPPEPVTDAPVQQTGWGKNRCSECGAKLSGGAKRYGHTKCGTCRRRDEILATGRVGDVQFTGHESAGKPSEKPGESPPVALQTPRSEPVPALSTPDSVHENVPLPNAPSPAEGRPLSEHLQRRCEDCRALLSRYNPSGVCARCEQKRIRKNVQTVREGGYPKFERVKVDEAPSRDSGAVAPRARGEVVLSGGKIAEPLTSTEVRRDEQGRVICSTCNQPMIHFGCGCDEGELDDDGIPLDTRWQDGVFVPDRGSGLASTG